MRSLTQRGNDGIPSLIRAYPDERAGNALTRALAGQPPRVRYGAGRRRLPLYVRMDACQEVGALGVLRLRPDQNSGEHKGIDEGECTEATALQWVSRPGAANS